MIIQNIKHNYILFVLLITSVLISCNKEEQPAGTGKIKFEFENVANGDLLVFGNTYLNAAGEEMTFSRFDYFISNIELLKADGSSYKVPKDSSYFLIKSISGESSYIQINNIPTGDYSSIRFIVGVDSAKSVAPLSERTGILDPANSDMYWDLNNGYIFVDVEGVSPQAPLNSDNNLHSISYRIGLYGGLSAPTLNNLKTIELSSDEPATVRSNIIPLAHIQTDIMKMFKSPNQVSVADNPIVWAIPYSKYIADNYQNMFTLEHIHN